MLPASLPPVTTACGSRRPLVAAVFLAGALTARPLLAQVASIDVSPASVQLRVGERSELLASAFDARGNLLPGVQYRWISNDPTVVRVEPDPTIPSLAVVIGIAPGITIVEVRVGNVFKPVAVQVAGEAPQPRPEVAERAEPVPDTVMASGVEERVRRLTARVRAFPFQAAPSCGSAFFVGGRGLLLTTYGAIRGADRLEVEADGRAIADVQVAAYSVQHDVAVLHLPGVTRGDSLLPGPQVVDQQVVWAFGHPQCGTVERKQLRIAGQQPAAGASVRLSAALGAAERGAPLVTQQGQVMAVAAGDATAVPGPRAADVLAEARNNVRLQALLTAQEVGRRERHLYGSLAISSGVAGTIARVRPLEAWHWPEAAAEAATPFTFAGPEGRYRVELVQNGQVVSTAEALVRPGVLQPVALQAAVAAGQRPGEPAQVRARGGGGFPVALVLLGLAGVGAGAALALGGGGEDGGGNGGGGGPTTGSITISVPNP